MATSTQKYGRRDSSKSLRWIMWEGISGEMVEFDDLHSLLKCLLN